MAPSFPLSSGPLFEQREGAGDVRSTGDKRPLSEVAPSTRQGVVLVARPACPQVQRGQPGCQGHFRYDRSGPARDRANRNRILSGSDQTHSSVASRAGEPSISNARLIAYVKEQIGYHSIEVTTDVYGHLVPGANRDAVDRLAVTGHPRAQPETTTGLRHSP